MNKVALYDTWVRKPLLWVSCILRRVSQHPNIEIRAKLPVHQKREREQKREVDIITVCFPDYKNVECRFESVLQYSCLTLSENITKRYFWIQFLIPLSNHFGKSIDM